MAIFSTIFRSTFFSSVIPTKVGIHRRVILKYGEITATLLAGGGPAATHFLCFAKESKQRKATRVRRTFCDKAAKGIPCAAHRCWPLRNSGFALRQSSRKAPASAALLGDSQREPSLLNHHTITRHSSEGWNPAAFALEGKLLLSTCAQLLFIAALLTGCSTTPKKIESTSPSKPNPTTPTKPGSYYQDDGPGIAPPPNIDAIADAIPRDEPLHRGANKPYAVLGKSYVPNVSNEPFKQTGVASWYGRKFHGLKTSTGEIYDMYAMTAAHPTLPLPSYARVTNPANGKSVVVRVNDRGPFLSDRIIDLSYTAAAKLDIARKGSGQVIVERVFAGEKAVGEKIPDAPKANTNGAIEPSVPASSSPSPSQITTPSVTIEAGALYLQLGAFASSDNAENFRLRVEAVMNIVHEPISIEQKNALYRVRMGPYKSRTDADAAVANVRAALNFSPVISRP